MSHAKSGPWTKVSLVEVIESIDALSQSNQPSIGKKVRSEIVFFAKCSVQVVSHSERDRKARLQFPIVTHIDAKTLLCKVPMGVTKIAGNVVNFPSRSSSSSWAHRAVT